MKIKELASELSLTGKEVLEKARIEQPYLTRLCRMLGYEGLYFSLKEGGQEEAI